MATRCSSRVSSHQHARGRVWYEQGSDSRAPWNRHLVGTVVGPMSLDVVDIDGDGDLDIIVGEHNLKNPETARLLVFENFDGHGGQWRERVIYTGDEHHDGALAVDIDGMEIWTSFRSAGVMKRCCGMRISGVPARSSPALAFAGSVPLRGRTSILKTWNREVACVGQSSLRQSRGEENLIMVNDSVVRALAASAVHRWSTPGSILA